MEIHEHEVDFARGRYAAYSHDCLKRLRKDLKNAKDRARRRRVVGKVSTRVIDYDNQLFQIDLALTRVKVCFSRIDKIEKQYADEAARAKKKPVDKTSGRNMLMPRLGR